MEKKSRIIGAFFLLLFLGLFLGDGKQGIIELYGTIVVLVLWCIAFFAGLRAAVFPRWFVVPWVVLGITSLLSTVGSDSIGFSVSWLVRLVSGYLICALSYNLAGNRSTRKFILGSLWFVSLGCIAAIVVKFFPPSVIELPSMNLLRLVYGHSHLADLLVFVAPAVVYVVGDKEIPRLIKKIIGPLYVLALLTTHAWTAWGLVGGYFLYEFVKILRRGDIKITKRIIAPVVVVVVVILMIVSSGSISSWEGRLANKKQSVAIRIEYWRQALHAFSERPLLGSGPGTFFLSSKRLQRTPRSLSWFAHSLPLQTASEIGVIGVAAYAWLIMAGLIAVRRSDEKSPTQDRASRHALLCSVALLLGYSLVEFTLDYFVVWLLFWASFGTLLGSYHTAVDSGAKRPQALIAAPLFLLGVFYLLWVVSAVSLLITNRLDIAFYAAPFDATSTLAHLEGKTGARPTKFGVNVALFFHRKNSAILRAIHDLPELTQSEKDSLLRDAVYADPHNLDLLGVYLKEMSPKDPRIVGADVIRLLSHALPPSLSPQINALGPDKEVIGEALRHLYEDDPPRLQEGYVSLVYGLGLIALSKNPDLTERLWVLSRDTRPDFAATHIELARFYQHVKHDNAKAQRILQACATLGSPKAQCIQFKDQQLLPPGDFYDALN